MIPELWEDDRLTKSDDNGSNAHSPKLLAHDPHGESELDEIRNDGDAPLSRHGNPLDLCTHQSDRRLGVTCLRAEGEHVLVDDGDEGAADAGDKAMGELTGPSGGDLCAKRAWLISDSEACQSSK